MRGEVHPYATLAYARTLAHVGRPIEVPAWQTHVIVRRFGDRATDAAGPYPITCFAGQCDLRAGLENLKDMGLVSVTAVIDELASPPIGSFQHVFSLVRPYKTHYLVDTTDGAYRPSDHHQREIRRAARLGVEVREVSLADILDGWTALYDDLIARHGISGVQRFSRASFEELTRCNGVATMAAFIGEEMVSCHVWMRHEDAVWSHLAASSARGYSTGAAYAVYDHSIRSFSGCTVSLGGSAGTGDSPSDGLARLKAGFANRSGKSFLIGSVLDAAEYQRLSELSCGDRDSGFFPMYRAPAKPPD